MIKVVAFDFDDTICLTEESTFNIENYVVKQMGFAPMTRISHQKNWGKPLKLAIAERIPGIDTDVFMQKVEVEISKAVKKGQLDNIPKQNRIVLKQILNSKKHIVILTSRSFTEAKHLLHKSHFLTSVVKSFYHKDNLNFLKPDPRVFDKLLKDLKVKPNECVYVGDSLSDAIAAKGAGMNFIAVLESRLRSKEDFKDLRVDYFADKFIDILKYFK